MFLREYKSEDCNETYNLFYNTVHTINSKDYREEQLNVWANTEIDLIKWDNSLKSKYTVIAEEDNIVVGFGNIDKTGYLDMLYIHKDYQGKGIATEICNNLESKYNVKEIEVHSSITAKSFFIKRGYKIVKEQLVERKGIYLTNFVMKKGL